MHVLRFQLLFFFWHAFLTNFFTVQSLLRLLFMNSNHNIWLSSMYGVHCLRTHKLHFLVTFSLKMGPMILFTHLKIILLQCFSVFSFQLYPNRYVLFPFLPHKVGKQLCKKVGSKIASSFFFCNVYIFFPSPVFVFFSLVVNKSCYCSLICPAV